MNLLSLFTRGYRGAGVVITYKDEVLLQLRRHPPVWSFIGGGMEKGEDFRACAVRELYEESGIRINESMLDEEPVHVLGFWHYKWVLFHCHLSERPQIHGLKEFSDEYYCYRFVPVRSYREAVRNEKHHHFYFFVHYQMKKINERLNLTN